MECTTIPSWLNKEFLTEVLSEKKSKIAVTKIKIEDAVPKGDNFLSTVYRIMVEYNEIEDWKSSNYKFLILKTLPVGEGVVKFLFEARCFEKEVQIYDTTFPAMYSIINEKPVNGELRPFSANSFATEMPNTLILEDLKHAGYTMGNRRKGLDLNHCKLTVRALARLHAASLALYNIDPTSMDLYEEGLYVDKEERRKETYQYFENYLEILTLQIEKWPGYEHYADKIRALIPTALDKMIQCVTPKKDSINVLNHGDCWVNNLLFRYCPNTGKVEDVKLVDFQIARFSSPALDLHYFFCTSSDDEVRFKQIDNLLSEYHQELRNSMIYLKLDPDQFTLQQLKEEFEDKNMFGFLTACTVLQSMLVGKSDVPDYSDVTEDEKKHMAEKMFAGRRLREVLQTVLIHFDRKGIL